MTLTRFFTHYIYIPLGATEKVLHEKVFGFLVGQAMKALRGKADPKKRERKKKFFHANSSCLLNRIITRERRLGK